MSHWDNSSHDAEFHWEQFEPRVKPSIDWAELGEQAKEFWHLAIDKGVDIIVRLVALREGLR